jgi:short-subunit dehydrogenase
MGRTLIKSDTRDGKFFSKETNMNTSSKGTALITGASSGIGSIYADQLAKRGYDLILVARNRERLDVLAALIANDTGCSVEIIVADLNNRADLARVERVLRTDASITLLVNNAGVASTAPLLDSDVEKMDEIIALNNRALMRLTYAAAPRFVARGRGSIINIASIVAIAPEILNGVYGASKAFVLALSQSLHHELAAKNVRIQAVLPGATATDIWEKAGMPLESLPKEIVMPVKEMVDAALAGFDQGEIVTIPALPQVADWEAYEAARQNLIPKLSLRSPAARYGVTALSPNGGGAPK